MLEPIFALDKRIVNGESGVIPVKCDITDENSVAGCFAGRYSIAHCREDLKVSFRHLPWVT